MANSDLFTFLFIFLLIFLPDQVATSNTTCHKRKCTTGAPSVRFPFRLRNIQPSNCGYSDQFDLSCNTEKQTIVTLPFSGDFNVRYIDYGEQRLILNDPGECLPRRFLNHDFNLTNSTFLYIYYGLENYTILHCPTEEAAEEASTFPVLSCLSTDRYWVIAVPTNSVSSLTSSSPCDVISTALIPLNSFVWDWDVQLREYVVGGIELAWDVPDCRRCEMKGGVCGFQNANSTQILCFPSRGLTTAALSALTVGLGFLSIVCIYALAVRYICNRRVVLSHQLPLPTVELSTLHNGRPSVGTLGLDSPTIESYPKIQIGECLELPESNDKICSICLCEYQANETLRSIPECNHYFHASCVHEWLRKNPTCPLCRNPPKTEHICL